MGGGGKAVPFELGNDEIEGAIYGLRLGVRAQGSLSALDFDGVQADVRGHGFVLVLVSNCGVYGDGIREHGVFGSLLSAGSQ